MNRDIYLGDAVEVRLQPIRDVSTLRRGVAVLEYLLVFAILAATELLALRWDVHPETALTTYRAGTLDLKADAIGRFAWWRQVDVGSWHIRRAGVCQGQQVNGLRGWLLWCRHGCTGGRAASEVDFWRQSVYCSHSSVAIEQGIRKKANEKQ